jgi:hypothetical protein
MVPGARGSETSSGERRTLSAADTEIQKVFVLGFGTLWVLLASFGAFASGSLVRNRRPSRESPGERLRG